MKLALIRNDGEVTVMPVSRPSLDVVVSRLDLVATGILLIDLLPASVAALPPFTPGAHIDLHLPGGLRRCYSLCNDPDERHRYVIAVNLDDASRGGSRYIHEHLRIGDRLHIDGPQNHFPLAEDAGRSVLIAGGIGITPLLSMARRLERLGRAWELHYGARTHARAAFWDELVALGGTSRVFGYFEDDPHASRPDLPALVGHAAAGTHFYCCGPAGLLAAFRGATAGLPAETVHLESFAPSAPARTAGGFTLQLARSGTSHFVPAGKTILDVLIDAGFDAPYACQQGICGTCRTRVLMGEVDHHDEVLTSRERAAGDMMMICCSRGKGDRLVLDL